MGKKSSPTPPPAPDPTAVANAQSQANIASAQAQQKMNMVNTSGPYGTVTYGSDPNAPSGYSQTTTLNPQEQQILDSGNKAQIGALGVANDQIGRVASALDKGLDPSGVQTTFNQGGPLQSSYAPGGQIQSSYDPGGTIKSQFQHGQQVQGQVGPQDLTGAYQAAANASYNQAASRLDPQWDLQQKQLQTQLANQGLSQDSDAYKNALDQFQRQKTDAYNQANYSSQGQGLNAENTIYNQALSQGQFANQAAGQEYTQNLGAAQFSNQAQAQYNQEMANLAQFANSAQAQRNAQNQQAAQFNNTTAAQQYAQNQGAAQFGNQANAQQFQQNAYSQSLPINEFNSLMSSGQVGMPTGINYTPSSVNPTDVLGAYALNSQVQNQNYQAQMQNQASGMGGLFNLGAAALMAPMTGGTSLGGTLAGGLFHSDVRLKRDIELIGREADGLGVYRYRYLNDNEPRIGVLAQEAQVLRPHAVVKDAHGFLMVHYGRL